MAKKIYKMVKLKCDNPNCGIEYKITITAYRKRIKNKLPQYCPVCMKKYKNDKIKNTFASYTIEEKIKFSNLIKAGIAAMSPEAKERRNANNSKSNKERYKNLSDDEKKRHNKSLLDYMANETEEQRKSRINKLIISLKKAFANKSVEEQSKQISDLFKNRDKYFASRSEEERERVSKLLSEIGKTRYELMTSEEQSTFRKRLLDYMANETEEQRKSRITKRSESLRKFYNELSYEERVQINRKYCETFNNHNIKIIGYMPEIHINNENNKLEVQFMKILNENNIKFIWQYYNLYPYPNFKELFPYNIQTGDNYVSPFHRWDFYIINKKTNIFIDIDGPIHDPLQNQYYKTCMTGEKILMSDIEKFYDSQRLYSTDNLPAYVIQCYDNTLSLDSKVVNIYNQNDIINIEKLLNLII